jgi:serine/threonine protein kinase/Tfp pilus assembly protein PilF
MDRKEISHYSLLRRLGAGGMGEVFLAYDRRLDRQVAVKLLAADVRDDPGARARFLREAKSAAAIDHPYVCKIFDAGDDDGVAFIAMEFVDGTTLQQRIASHRLPPEECIRIAVEIGDALVKAHETGFVHRDLKPSNVMLTRDDHVKVMDFGLAKRVVIDDAAATSSGTAAGVLLGTLAYMSPEQLGGRPVDHRSDVFAFGLILFEMLAAVHPFARPTGLETAGAMLSRDAPRLSTYVSKYPALLDSIIGRCLSKRVDERYQTMAEARADLLRCRSDRYTLASEPITVTTIAVLPFVNMSGDTDSEYFGDGITEDIIAALARRADLKVIARSSSMLYKRSALPVQEIARTLGADRIIEGSLRRADDQVRIVASLVDAVSGRQLWVETFDRQMRDAFAIQADVGRQIALAMQLRAETDRDLRQAPMRDPEAYHAYLKGRYFLNKLAPGDLQKAVQYFSESLEIDATYGQSHAGLSTCYVTAGHFMFLPAAEAFPRAKDAARRALELDERLAEAQTSMALVSMFYEWDWPAAERNFQRAREINPSYVDARVFYSWFLTSRLRFPEALAEARYAVELDPLSLVANTNLGWVLVMSGQPDEAIPVLRKTLELHPEFVHANVCLATALGLQNRHAEGIDILKRWRWNDAQLGQAYAIVGEVAEAREVLSTVLAAGDQNQRLSDIGILQLLLGDDEDGFATLRRALDRRETAVLSLHGFVRLTPALFHLRQDARYVSLMHALNLPVTAPGPSLPASAAETGVA